VTQPELLMAEVVRKLHIRYLLDTDLRHNTITQDAIACDSEAAIAAAPHGAYAFYYFQIIECSVFVDQDVVQTSSNELQVGGLHVIDQEIYDRRQSAAAVATS
jgi:hypothetical protein